jgi:hypothetical protein
MVFTATGAKLSRAADLPPEAIPALERYSPVPFRAQRWSITPPSWPIRFSGPWQEAQARLAGRRTGVLARIGNRFWIGQPRMPFAVQ